MPRRYLGWKNSLETPRKRQKTLAFEAFLRSASTLAVRVGDKIGALKGLAMRLREISQYLSQVVAGKLPMNQARHRFRASKQSFFRREIGVLDAFWSLPCHLRSFKWPEMS